MNPNKTVLVRLSGGIGNQLFQLSSAFVFSKSNNFNLAYYIEKNDFYKRDFYLQDLVKELGAIYLQISDLDNPMHLNDLTFYKPETLYDSSINTNIVMQGSFQNIYYLYSHIEVIRSIFRPWLFNSLNSYQRHTFTNSLHLRLAHSMSKDLSLVNNATPLPHYFICDMINLSGIKIGENINIVTDLPINHPDFISYYQLVSNSFADLGLNPLLPNKNRTPLEDLFILANTSDYLFLSNSTFSIWGSILNIKAKIHAPYLGNLEKWASNIPSVKQYYFNALANPNFSNHLNAELSPYTDPYSIQIKFLLKFLSLMGAISPYARSLKHKLERYYSKRFL